MSQRRLRRYTNLASLIHLLKRRTITLLNPATWDDRNDAYFMSEYKRIKEAETVLALCFTTASETYHHWRVFSHGSDGVCIEFDHEKLMWAFEDETGVRHGKVNYRRLLDFTAKSSINVEELPLLKREPFSAESEYRVFYVDMDQTLQHKDFDIDLDCIIKIQLSPWMPKTVARTLEGFIRELPLCDGIAVSTSRLIDNDGWKQLTARVKSPAT